MGRLYTSSACAVVLVTLVACSSPSGGPSDAATGDDQTSALEAGSISSSGIGPGDAHAGSSGSSGGAGTKDAGSDQESGGGVDATVDGNSGSSGSSGGSGSSGSAGSSGGPDASSAGDAGGGDAGSAGSDAGPATVSGRVIDPVGEGLPGVPVVIAGHATTTDSSGHFSVPNIQSPYEAVLSYTPLGRYLVYEGVKRLDPTFVVMSAGQWSSATASVTLGGNWSSADAGLRTDVAIHSSTVWFQGTGGTATASPYSMPLYWYGPPSGSANVFGLQWAQDSGVATSFLGFASTPVSVADGGSPSASLSFASVTSSTLSGTVTAPSNYTINSYNVGVVDWSQYAEDISFSYAGGTAAGSDSFSFPVPNVGSPYEIEFVVGAEWMDLSTYQQHESSVRVNAPSSPVALTLPASSTLTAPAGVFSGPATNVTTSTTFAWTPSRARSTRSIWSCQAVPSPASSSTRTRPPSRCPISRPSV